MNLHHRTFGYLCIGLAIIGTLVRYFFGSIAGVPASVLSLSTVLLFLTGLVTVVDWSGILKIYFFDNEEYKKNADRDKLVKTIRLRALLLHNFSVGVLLVTVVVILGALFAFAEKPSVAGTDTYGALINWSVGLVLLIFLVQALFRVFKYLLRVGSFYHGIADALELHRILNTEMLRYSVKERTAGREVTPPTSADLDKLLERLAPSAYDISDVEAGGLLSAIKDVMKK